jgi:flagellar biosynthetic protein FliR
MPFGLFVKCRIIYVETSFPMPFVAREVIEQERKSMPALDMNLLMAQFQVFLLVFVRISSMVATAPVFGSSLIRIPVQLLAGMASALSLVVMMNLPADLPIPGFGMEFGMRIMGEVVMGLSMGFLATLILAGIQFGGELIDHMVGFAVVQVIDPISNESASIIGNLKGLLGTILFLMFHGHIFLFQGLIKTFHLVPPGGVGLVSVGQGNGLFERLMPLFLGYSEMMFVVGLQVATPCLLVMSLIWVPEAFLARMVPQLNLLVNDVPFRIALGLFLVWLGLAPFVDLTGGLVSEISTATDRLALAFAGR